MNESVIFWFISIWKYSFRLSRSVYFYLSIYLCVSHCLCTIPVVLVGSDFAWRQQRLTSAAHFSVVIFRRLESGREAEKQTITASSSVFISALTQKPPSSCPLSAANPQSTLPICSPLSAFPLCPHLLPSNDPAFVYGAVKKIISHERERGVVFPHRCELTHGARLISHQLKKSAVTEAEVLLFPVGFMVQPDRMLIEKHICAAGLPNTASIWLSNYFFIYDTA